MEQSPIKAKLARGESVLGVWSLIPSPAVVEITAAAGMDFQILDMEHGVIDLASLESCVRACEGANCAPLVRVPGVAPFVVQSVLDIGAHGVVVPQVSGYDAALAAVRATKYPPDGVRGYNPFTRAAGYDPSTTTDKGKLRNDFGFVSIIVESKGALDELDRILEIPQLDMVYLGVYDMACALGCGGDTRAPAVVEFVNSTIPRIRRAGKAAGLMVRSEAELTRAAALGANVMVYAVDTYLIRRQVESVVGEFHRSVRVRKGA